MTGRQAAPKPWKPPTHVRYWEAGYEVAMHNVGRLALDLRQEGTSDADAVDAVLSLVQLRMMTGSEDPVGELTGGDRTWQGGPAAWWNTRPGLDPSPLMQPGGQTVNPNLSPRPPRRWRRRVNRAELEQLRREVIADSTMTDQNADQLERRIIALEKIVAARWPRSILVRRRLARDLRASVAGYGWVGPDFESRRVQAIGDGWIEPLSATARQRRTPPATHGGPAAHATLRSAFTRPSDGIGDRPADSPGHPADSGGRSARGRFGAGWAEAAPGHSAGPVRRGLVPRSPRRRPGQPSPQRTGGSGAA